MSELYWFLPRLLYQQKSLLLGLTLTLPSNKELHDYQLTCEVELGLEREEGKSEAEERRDSDGHEDPVGVVVDGDAGHPQGEREGEDGQSNLEQKNKKFYSRICKQIPSI